MNNANHDFLKFLITEEVYLIDHQKESSEENDLIEESQTENTAIEEEKSEVITKTESESVASIDSSPKQETSIEEKETPTVTPFAKGSQNKILVVFDNIHNDNIDPIELSHLTKILSAVKIEQGDIELSHIQSTSMASFMKYEKAIVFTSNHEMAAKNQHQYHVVQMGKTSILFADDLSTIFSNQNLKKSLWQSLKTLFGLS